MSDTYPVPYWINTIVACFLTACGSALVVGLPLLFKINRLRTEVKSDNLNIAEREHEHEVRVNIDAKWEELLKARVDELARLQLRDDQQAQQIKDLYEQHVKCQRQEAVLTERAKVMDLKITSLEERLAERDRSIAALEERFKFFEAKM